MQARLVQAASGSDLARQTAIGNLGVNARQARFGPVVARTHGEGSPSNPKPPPVTDGYGEVNVERLARARRCRQCE